MIEADRRGQNEYTNLSLVDSNFMHSLLGLGYTGVH
jgi:hypothetical protein